jgi:hypothetical protein
MRRALLIAILSAVSLLGLSGVAQAIVVDTHALGQTSVPFDASNRSSYEGVALVPHTCDDLVSTGTCGVLAKAKVPTVVTSAPCADPALTPDLVLPNTGICFHGGAVMAQNETFALAWDARRWYWAGTRSYVEQFLRDVADGSGTRTSPYAVTQQYVGTNGRALNSSRYGGGCIDYGSVGGSACEFGNPAGAGHDYPANGCKATGDSFTSLQSVGMNAVCLTDSQLQHELSTMITQTGMVGRTQPGYTPLVTLLLPPGVETCLDAANVLCSANGGLTPPPPNPTTSATGGTVAPGTYYLQITYATATGESSPTAATKVVVSASSSTTGGGTTGGTGGGTTGPTGPQPASTSTITIPSPPPATGATGWYVYITQPDGTTLARQPGPIPIGTPRTLTAPPTTGGPKPPTPLAFCSYHSQVAVGGTEVAYVVQPWTVATACDEPNAPALTSNDTPQALATKAGIRIVSPLSRSHIASIVNPGLDGWFALGASEIDDNATVNQRCVPLPDLNGGIALANGLGGDYDSATVGTSSQNPYLLQREFNNAGVIESDPNTYFGCAPNVLFSPAFVVPTSVTQGKEVQFDGSTTASTLMVPNRGYTWNFGDGTTRTGASVVHAFKTAGNYTVTLRVIDLGYNVGTVSQTIQVLEPDGRPAPPAAPRLQVRMLLLPQSLGQVLRRGISALLSSNEAGDGFASVLISRAAARRAHIKAGSAPFVVIGRGTVSGVKDGRISLRLHLSRAVATKLKHLKHLTLTIHLTLVSTTGQRVGLAIAGSY